MEIRSKMYGGVFCLAACALSLVAGGCELVSQPDRSTIPGLNAGDTRECSVPEDCDDPGNACLRRACTQGKCVPAKVAAGTPAAAQMDGDCQTVVCDGAGAGESQADDGDLPVDGNECTHDVCKDGVPSNPPIEADTACGKKGALRCDGHGACVGCTKDAECGETTDCASATCSAGTCKTDFAAPGMPAATQTDGDCLEVQCDGIGGTKSVFADGDVANDGNECTEDRCEQGAPSHPNAASGTVCSTGGGHRCDGAGACVECLTGADCASLVCSLQSCAAPACTDAVKNGDETDVDCGGPDCGGCADGGACGVGDDCTSGVCDTGTCAIPTCTDVVKNGDETDVDCGGGTCQPCVDGKACAVGADCASDNCTASVCQPPVDDEPSNDACAGATPEALPASVQPLHLPTSADVDWFAFTAAAADVGKQVHVVTTATGTPPCDTVVEVFAGASCASLVSLGGPSSDADYGEDWLSTPITAAGPFWVQVTYSSFGFSGPDYALAVSLQ